MAISGPTYNWQGAKRRQQKRKGSQKKQGSGQGRGVGTRGVTGGLKDKYGKKIRLVGYRHA